MTGAVGLYIHIPFCHARCGYCDFAMFTGQEESVGRYLDALTVEMKSHGRRKIKTIFVGGGTPTVLSPIQIDSLFNSIRSSFDASALTEVTTEANPESATEETLTAFKRNGVNRLSFGLQTTDNALLKEIDRLHTFELFLERYELARRLGFKNINVDLIFGLPNQTAAAWEKTLRDVLRLAPEHISAYALKVETGTAFAKDHVEADPDLQAEMYLKTSEILSEAGYFHYEISNFARPGFESEHNLLYWQNAATIGVGLSAASHLGRRRWKNMRGLIDYVQASQEGKPWSVENVELSEDEQHRENMMLALRLRRGVPVDEVEKLNIPVATSFVEQGLALIEKGFYRLTPRGWLLSNQLFQHLI